MAQVQQHDRDVLIVDDNPSMRLALRIFLENQLHLHVCGEAADGVEAIEIARKRSPKAVVLDLSMPNLNGVEAASIIRQFSPNARIIVFTLYGDSFGARVAQAIGVDVVVSKAEGADGLIRALGPLLSEDFAPGPAH